MELSQKQLEELDQGRPPDPQVVFFEKAKLNHEKSEAAGRRIYDKVVYLKATHPGVTDWVPYMATKADIANYPEEYAYFMRNKQGDRVPGIEIIPGLDLIHMQELLDMGIVNINQLAGALTVPQHLEYAHRGAKIIQSALQESLNGNRIEENHSKETHSEETRDVPPVVRQQDIRDERQPPVQASHGDRAGKTPEGVRPGGFPYGGQGLNWEVTFSS